MVYDISEDYTGFIFRAPEVQKGFLDCLKCPDSITLKKT
jgi:hypothetical protein